MAEFQKKVTGYPAQGLPGQPYDGEFVTAGPDYVSNGEIEPGMFVFAKANELDYPQQVHKSASGGRLVGLVMRSFTSSITNFFASSTNVYPKLYPVTIAKRGRFYFKVPSGTPQIGQNVIVNPANGAVSFGAAGTANDTGWTVVRFDKGAKSAAAGDMIVIEGWGLDAKPSA